MVLNDLGNPKYAKLLHAAQKILISLVFFAHRARALRILGSLTASFAKFNATGPKGPERLLLVATATSSHTNRRVKTKIEASFRSQRLRDINARGPRGREQRRNDRGQQDYYDGSN